MTKGKLIGRMIYYVLSLLASTLRLKVHAFEGYDRNDQYIYSFWHGKMFLSIIALRNIEKSMTLVSPSKDGDILAEVLARSGYEVMRGSSNRENVRSLVGVIRILRQGYKLGFATDGPRGPLHQAKPGTIFMAQKTGAKIVPVGSAFKRKWVLEKTWDKFELPKPFTRAVYVIGSPISVKEDADVEESRRLLEDRINEANTRAAEMIDALD